MPAERYEFADIAVDFRRMEVRRAGQVVPLEPKALDVLRHLMANADRVVTKDELLDLCWRETFVTPNALTRAIALLRKALGDDAFEARYIETVSKRGYRFIASLASSRGSASAPSPIRLTVTRASHTSPSISADGGAVAYASDRSGASEIYLTGLAAGSRELPLTSDGGHNTYPALSPDGRWVAYHSRASAAAHGTSMRCRLRQRKCVN